MKKTIEAVRKQFIKDSAVAKSAADIESLRVAYMGKKGKLNEIMPMLKGVPNEQKKEIGLLINSLKGEIESRVAELVKSLENQKIQEQINNAEKIDITLPVDTAVGSLHPRTMVQKEIEDVFISMGFTIETGDEVATEHSNFDAVNVPKTHPARDMQDTFWLDNGQLLRTHTSALQNKILKKYNGPLKVIMPGRCFRNEAVDAKHETTFFQIEGMIVDKNISVANLIYFMKEMLSKVFKKDVEVRLRPGYFPFVEPGFELDAKCPFCNGDGCQTCGKSGWLELCPCGMIHPEVLRLAGMNPEEYSGCAFGLGFDRLVMIRSEINDIRLLTSGNLKVLKPFGINL